MAFDGSIGPAEFPSCSREDGLSYPNQVVAQPAAAAEHGFPSEISGISIRFERFPWISIEFGGIFMVFHGLTWFPIPI